jgi:hypothetical protein
MKMDFRPISPADKPLVPESEEQVAQACLECVMHCAQGEATLFQGEALCNFCGCALRAGLGHDIGCLTLRARRMLITDPVLRERFALQQATAPLLEVEVDIDALNRLRGAVVTKTLPLTENTDERTALAELTRLRALIDSPVLHDFARGVVLEAVHQQERWASPHDGGKEPADWFWLLGYLTQKAMMSQLAGDIDKALHHTITAAAALANWHDSILGNKRMRPGIGAPADAGQVPVAST